MTVNILGEATNRILVRFMLAISTVVSPAMLPAECIAGNKGYVVVVKTGDVRNAGTDADVVFIATGTDGTAEWVLDNPSDDRERGDLDIHVLKGDIGTIQEVRIKSREEDANPDGPDWYLDSVNVYRIPDADSFSGLVDAAILRLLDFVIIGTQADFKFDGWIKPAHFTARNTPNEWTVTKLTAK